MLVVVLLLMTNEGWGSLLFFCLTSVMVIILKNMREVFFTVLYINKKEEDRDKDRTDPQ